MSVTNIQIFGGPGTGKSTIASGLFYKMKMDGLIVESIQEYAKDLTYGEDFIKLSDQLYLLGEQHHRLRRVSNHVDFIVHDSPFIMGITYLQEDEHIPLDTLKKLTIEMYKSYDNFNVFLERDENNGYQEYGRTQTLNEAIEKDNQIKKLLDDNDIPYMVVKSNHICVDVIYEALIKREAKSKTKHL